MSFCIALTEGLYKRPPSAPQTQVLNEIPPPGNGTAGRLRRKADLIFRLTFEGHCAKICARRA